MSRSTWTRARRGGRTWRGARRRWAGSLAAIYRNPIAGEWRGRGGVVHGGRRLGLHFAADIRLSCTRPWQSPYVPVKRYLVHPSPSSSSRSASVLITPLIKISGNSRRGWTRFNRGFGQRAREVEAREREGGILHLVSVERDKVENFAHVCIYRFDRVDNFMGRNDNSTR